MPEALLSAIWGESVRLSEPGRLVHLQFRRFAGSPGCGLHLREFSARYDEIGAAGVVEVVVFHSRAEALRAHHGELPFAVVADPGRWLYQEFAVGRSARAVLHPKAVRAALRGFAASRRLHLGWLWSGRGSLPADFLIDASGHVLACRQGSHPYDQWSVEEVLALASEYRPALAI
ncbi:MAG TPA: redoxin domain-containing protein [Solirubrobacterales bacterium]|jgi:peroxiredoxin